MTDSWDHLMKYFGTHYIVQAKWGARETQVTTFVKTEMERLKKEGINVKAEASASFNIISGSVKTETDVEKERR